MRTWLLPATAVVTVLTVVALLVFQVVDMQQDARSRTEEAERRAEANRQLLEEVTRVLEVVKKSGQEHRCWSELTLMQQTDLILFRHTHPERYEAHLEDLGCEEFLEVLPGLPTGDPTPEEGGGDTSDPDLPESANQPPPPERREPPQRAPPRSDPPRRDPPPPEDNGGDDGDDPLFLCVDAPLLPRICL